jgi:hypothetical protein
MHGLATLARFVGSHWKFPFPYCSMIAARAARPVSNMSHLALRRYGHAAFSNALYRTPLLGALVRDLLGVISLPTILATPLAIGLALAAIVTAASCTHDLYSLCSNRGQHHAVRFALYGDCANVAQPPYWLPLGKRNP